jgi:hypothetical protein
MEGDQDLIGQSAAGVPLILRGNRYCGIDFVIH